jgi:hypothetical protein
MENLYVQRYQGEMLYTGGMGVRRLTLRNVRSENTNGSTFNLYGAQLLVEDCEFGGPSRFWMELTSRQNGCGWQENEMVVRNCYFHGAQVGGGSICPTQTDGRSYSFTFEGNTFEECYMVFGIYGTVGPVVIRNNDILGSRIMQFRIWGNSETNWNRNVTFEGNRVTDGSFLWIGNAAPDDWSHTGDVTIRNNVFDGQGTDMDMVVYGNGNKDGWTIENVLVEGNSFTQCRMPRWDGVWDGDQPLFRNNTYSDAGQVHGQTVFNLAPSSAMITPSCDQAEVYAS